MPLSIFGEKAIMPTEEMLAAALKDSKPAWDSLKARAGTSEQWKYYSKKAGWSLIIKSGDRTVLYLIPQDAGFKVNFVLGEKATIAAQAAGLPEAVLALLSEAKPYVEGRSLMFDVKTEADLEAAMKLIEVKGEK